MLPGGKYQPPRPARRKGVLKKKVRITRKRKGSWFWGEGKENGEHLAAQYVAAPLVAIGTLFWAGYKAGEAASRGLGHLGRGALGLLAVGGRGAIIGGKRYNRYIRRNPGHIFTPRDGRVTSLAADESTQALDAGLGGFCFGNASPTTLGAFSSGPSASGGRFSSGGN